MQLTQLAQKQSMLKPDSFWQVEIVVQQNCDLRLHNVRFPLFLGSLWSLPKPHVNIHNFFTF